MTTPDMSDKEMEASISLLHMMQPAESPAADVVTKGHDAGPENRDALHESLMKVVAKQASDELSLPRIAAHKKLHQRGARLTALSRELTLEELRPYFGRPIVEVARKFGICTTFLKKICRRCGIKRWPHRQIRSLNRTIQMLEQVESVSTNPIDRARYATQIEDLKEKQRAVMEDPDAYGKLKRMKRYTIPKGATDPSSTPVGQNSGSLAQPLTAKTPDDPADSTSLSALATAVDSVSSNPTVKASAFRTKSVHQVPSPLGVQIPSSTLSAPSTLTTPLHAAASNHTPLALKISPNNRKLLLVKGSAENTVSSPVVTLCGHLYCWPCLYQWMQSHSECPVCKAGVSEQNVIPVYARGADAADPRTHQQVPDSGIPHRPRGQRPDAEQLRRRRPFNFGIFNGNGQGNAFSMSPTIGFFPALFGVPYQPPAPVTHHQDGTPLTAQEARQQMQQAFLSRFLLIVGSLVILCLITF
ncbi:hypothetical protein JG688_00000877 [Phytophthora aleatoria]|uniref:RING-type E3 ubiquitin transferase n=1 Tax=Phytophthora aleatoria TaxID=2496075 RepID=A0A8J5MBY6_9STRA|nr:hypothetical protein JG688_00000877 [Phytophthora aleatoria]